MSANGVLVLDLPGCDGAEGEGKAWERPQSCKGASHHKSNIYSHREFMSNDLVLLHGGGGGWLGGQRNFFSWKMNLRKLEVRSGRFVQWLTAWQGINPRLVCRRNFQQTDVTKMLEAKFLSANLVPQW